MKQTGGRSRESKVRQRLAKAEFHQQVGMCITAWANVNQQLFNICFDILGSTKDRVSIVFYSSPTIATRLRLVDELVLSVLPKREKKTGATIMST